MAPRAAGRSGTATGPDWSLPDDANVAGFDPMEEVGVPRDQRPVNELKSLRETFLYAWAALPPQQLGGRLAGFFAGVTALLSAPIAGATFDVSREPAQLCLAASAASLAVLLVLLLRIYLGWEYVGKRLLSAVVEYEETGWYDGQTFVKPPKVLFLFCFFFFDFALLITPFIFRHRCWRATACWAPTRCAPCSPSCRRCWAAARLPSAQPPPRS